MPDAHSDEYTTYIFVISLILNVGLMVYSIFAVCHLFDVPKCRSGGWKCWKSKNASTLPTTSESAVSAASSRTPPPQRPAPQLPKAFNPRAMITMPKMTTRLPRPTRGQLVAMDLERKRNAYQNEAAKSDPDGQAELNAHRAEVCEELSHWQRLQNRCGEHLIFLVTLGMYLFMFQIPGIMFFVVSNNTADSQLREVFIANLVIYCVVAFTILFVIINAAKRDESMIPTKIYTDDEEDDDNKWKIKLFRMLWHHITYECYY